VQVRTSFRERCRCTGWTGTRVECAVRLTRDRHRRVNAALSRGGREDLPCARPQGFCRPPVASCRSWKGAAAPCASPGAETRPRPGARTDFAHGGAVRRPDLVLLPPVTAHAQIRVPSRTLVSAGCIDPRSVGPGPGPDDGPASRVRRSRAVGWARTPCYATRSGCRILRVAVPPGSGRCRKTSPRRWTFCAPRARRRGQPFRAPSVFTSALRRRCLSPRTSCPARCRRPGVLEHVVRLEPLLHEYASREKVLLAQQRFPAGPAGRRRARMRPTSPCARRRACRGIVCSPRRCCSAPAPALVAPWPGWFGEVHLAARAEAVDVAADAVCLCHPADLPSARGKANRGFHFVDRTAQSPARGPSVRIRRRALGDSARRAFDLRIRPTEARTTAHR